MAQTKYTRKDRKVAPDNYGWQHIDVRLNKDGTFDILLDSLGVVGIEAGKAAQIEGFKDHGIATYEEALDHAKKMDAWLEEQWLPASKRTTKKDRADTHYSPAVALSPAPGQPASAPPEAPAAPLVLEPEPEPPPPPPEPKKFTPPPPAPAPKAKETIKAGQGPSLGLFDD